MAAKQTAFGIDFGTTNTRVAYYDGERLRIVPFVTPSGQFYQLPTLISYKDGTVAAVGPEARKNGTLPSRSIKWLLDQNKEVEIDGGAREPVEIVADFFRHLRRMVRESVKGEPFDRAALTIPVHYPPNARKNLQEACRIAGIEVTHFFFEPIAAIYCSLVADQVVGATAVFDWGGGSLDIATVQIRDGVALTRQIDGWHRGGTDFDRLICQQALDDFLLTNPQPGFSAEAILDRMKMGRDLKLLAELAKIQLSKQSKASLNYIGFLGGKNLDCTLTRAEFDDLIASDVISAMTRLEQALSAADISPKLLARMFLSGGTCNIPAVRDRLAAEIAGNRIVDKLQLPANLKMPGSLGGLEDIGNATALGAALLAVNGSGPVLANSIGVRLADSMGDQFYPVFRAGEDVSFNTKKERFFVSDASAGVGRLLVCDQDDPVRQPSGRMLRVIAVPIHRQETWIDVSFTIDKFLVLRVEATGRKDVSRAQPALIQNLKLGFRIPESFHPSMPRVPVGNS
jgi:molecular chaperone DnaK (HSP70)